MAITIPIDYIVNTIIAGVIGWAVKVILDTIKHGQEESKGWRIKVEKDIQDIKDATQANVRTNILHYCEKYIDRGWITPQELDSLTDLHKKYRALNDNNGFIDSYMHRVDNLERREV